VEELGLSVDRTQNEIIDSLELIFIGLFTCEAVIKIISLGFIIGKSCYLRDPWNWLDFTVVITGLLVFMPAISNFGFLRMFRLLRPLRNLSVIATMKTVINTLFTSMRQLLYIIILNLFIILVFAIFGLHLWNGVIHYRCRLTKYPVNGDWPVDPNDMRTCSKITIAGSHMCPVACGSLYDMILPDENGVMQDYGPLAEGINIDRDTMYPEFNYGLTNFDNIGFAYLTVFQVVTLEGWVKIMEIYNDGDSLILSTIFFVLCVLICSHFLLNLTIAVMLDNFKQINQQNEDLQQLQFQQN
jgi:succinate dehydrogenase/fumarate reductase cytochrome b subunit